MTFRRPAAHDSRKQVAVTRIMIRVLMGGRDRLDVSERSAGQEQLAGCSIPSIDDINRIADDRCIGRLVAWLGRRPSAVPSNMSLVLLLARTALPCSGCQIVESAIAIAPA